MTCRLCGSSSVHLLLRGGQRAYRREFLHCRRCDLVFVPDRFLLPPAEERQRYLLHENDPDDEGYRRFLARLSEIVVPLVEPGAESLDYGCGQPPVLVMMLREAGLQAAGWDLFFRRDEVALRRSYD
ncbi:MAG: methyltransferase, partial [Armatimonadota bacterium]